MNIVVDTNIFISAIIKNGISRKLIIDSPFNLILPKYALGEIKKYEKFILKKSKLSSEELTFLIRTLLKYFSIVPINFPKNITNYAKSIMDSIDNKDSIFIATALHHNSLIWSDDKHFKKQNQIKTFTTKEIIDFLEKE